MKKDVCIITGSQGFIGSNLIKLLDSKNIAYLPIDLPYKDILDEDLEQQIDVACRLYNVLGIFHLAAISRIPESFEFPYETLNVNIAGTNNVLSWAKKLKLKVVYAGSSSFYADPMLNPYAFSKAVGESICEMYSKHYAVKTCVARFFNVYGDHAIDSDYENTTVVSQFKKRYLSNQPLIITGDGQQRRDFIHVNDIVSALFHLMTSDADVANNATPIDIGTGKNYSINELANLFTDAKITYESKRPGEAETTLADCSTMQSLGWNPECSLEEYIASIKRLKK